MPGGAIGRSKPTGNGLLDALSTSQFDELSPELDYVELQRGEVLISPHAAIIAVYFPVGGMVSLVRTLADGSPVEIGVIGREGMVGWPAIFSADMGSIEAMVQLPISSYRASAGVFLRFVDAHPDFSLMLHRSVQALFLQVAQTAACNRHHSNAQRLAKWLLLADDRSGAVPMRLTHEFLAMMLGMRRAGVTEAISDLKAAGVLSSASGNVAILDRPTLEKSACECYGVIQEEARRLTKPLRV